MCGIFGIWDQTQSPVSFTRWLHQATTAMRHRGPDDEGYLLLDTATKQCQAYGGTDTMSQLALPHISTAQQADSADLCFGFRRLAILDLSEAGHQPMRSADGSCWVVYNGEIYNYIELRDELRAKGHTFRSESDTEVVLAAYQEWGESCLERFNGMWAMALWDSRKEQLFCARDRFGIKPFYYFWNGETFAFASEIKALLELPFVARQANDGVIYDYLRYGRMDIGSETFFDGIKRLPPANFMLIGKDASRLIEREYWSLPSADDVSDAAESTQISGLAKCLHESIRLRLRSDVTVGSCLSGGLDSSTIVCIANQLLRAQDSTASAAMGDIQKTFSSCYEDERFDEREYIEAVLQQTQAERNYTFPNGSKLLDDLPRLVWHQDEPFAGLSIFSQWSVMQSVAAKNVTVLLDGQGADELLAGYHPCFDYHWGGLLKSGQWGAYRRELNGYSQRYDASMPYLAVRSMRPFAPASLQGFARRFERGGGAGINAEFNQTHRHRAYEFVERGANPLHGYLSQLVQYSIPMLLRFEDRNSMAHSIEARVPFLDHNLVEYAFRLPNHLKLHQGETKVALRRAMQKTLPAKVQQRKDKMGFVAPASHWFREDLHEWVQDLVGSSSFRNRPYFDVPQIQNALAEQQSGQRDLSKLAWRWINLELWHRQFIDHQFVDEA